MKDRFEVVALANRTRKTAEEFASFAGLSMDGYTPDYHELLERSDVEAVLIGVPIDQLYPIARDSAQAGKHVCVEKPLGSNEIEAREFLALESEYPSLKILMAENFFYMDRLRLARSLVDEGKIGKPMLYVSQRVSQLVPQEGEFSVTPWRHQANYRGGAALDGGVHTTAGIRLVVGDFLSMLGRYVEYNPIFSGPTGLLMSFSLSGGVLGDVVMGFPANKTPEPQGHPRLYGAEGVLTLERETLKLTDRDGNTREFGIANRDGGYYNEFLNFYEAIVYDEPIVGTLAQSYKNLLAITGAMDSAEQNRIIGADELNGGIPLERVPLWKPRGADGLFDGLPSSLIER